MPYCSQCGTEVSVQSRFCRSCGAEVNPPLQSPTREPPTPSDVNREQGAEPPGGNGLPSLGSLIFVVLIIVGMAVFYKEVFIPEREKARTSSCQSNLKQIGLAMAMYKNDYNETEPPASAGDQGWVTLLQPYIKNTQIFVCPSAVSLTDSGYELNVNVSGIKDAAVGNVAEVVSAWDSTTNTLSAASECANVDTRHGFGRGLNALFYDGHVKWLMPNESQFNCFVESP